MRRFRLPGLLILRSLLKELRGLQTQVAAQTAVLTRLADHVAPIAPAHDPATVRAESGVDFADDQDQFLLQEYAARIHNDTGHWPTDEQLLTYLADEKTRDLHTRLVERDRELDRLTREGR